MVYSNATGGRRNLARTKKGERGMKKQICGIVLILVIAALSIPAMAADTGNTSEATAQDPEAYQALHRKTEAAENQIVNPAERVMLFANSTKKSIYTGKTYIVPAGKTITEGIDVSKWDGTINWSKVKAAGTDFAIIRAGYTGYGNGTLYADDTYATNMKNAAAVGMPVGVYIYSQATTTAEAKKEAQFCLNAVKGYSVKLPIVMDVEFAEDSGGYTGRLYKANLSKTQQTNICLAFCETVAAAGYTPMVYANRSMLTSNMNASTISAKYPIWLANYTTSTSYTGDYSYWQYSETGIVNGISTAIDCNFRIQSGNQITETASIALNETSVERACGYTKQLTATVKPSGTAVTWTSSDTSIAKVSSSGKVTAVSPGKATITATAGSVKATCTVTVRPAKVTVTQLKRTDSGYNQLSWNKSAGSSTYVIYRSSNGTSYTSIGSTTGTSYTDTSATSDKAYYYKVIGQKTVSGTTYKSVYSAVASRSKIPGRVSIKSAKSASSKVTISWKAASNASYYKVYRSTTGKTGSYKLVKTVKSGTTYTSAKLTKGKTYYFRIFSVRSTGGIKYQARVRTYSIRVK